MSPPDRAASTKAIKRELARLVWASASHTSVGEDTYRALFVANPEPMWVYDVTTLQVLDVNDAAVERYGYSRAEFLRLTIKDLRPDEDVPKLLELTQELPASDRSGPWRHRLRDASVIQVLITSRAVVFSQREARLVMAERLTPDSDTEV